MSQSMLEEARLSARLQELRGEFARGEAQIADMDQRRVALRDTLLRISGAIQVLEELVENGQRPDSVADHGNGVPPIQSLNEPDVP